MADSFPPPVGATPGPAPTNPPSIEQARAMARERFRSRLLTGEKIGDCACHDEAAAANEAAAEPTEQVTGVRFRDSGRTFYFRPGSTALQVGDWVVVETSRGREAGRVVIAPHQVRLNQLDGELKPILRRMGDDDVRRLEELKRDAASAVRTFGARIRARELALKPVSAEYSFDGAALVLNYSTPDRERAPGAAALRDLTRELAGIFGCRVELRPVGPREVARLLGGLGRCGRTLCCSSWLPVFPEISMSMAKSQDLPLNPSKVSGVCGRLLCCLSYENEQYKQMKAVMPRLGQTIETPAGPAVVQAMQLLKELVTVRLVEDHSERVFSSAELGIGSAGRPEGRPPVPRAEPQEETGTIARGGTDLAPGEEPPPLPTTPGTRRRRRRRGRRTGSEDAGTAGANGQ